MCVQYVKLVAMKQQYNVSPEEPKKVFETAAVLKVCRCTVAEKKVFEGDSEQATLEKNDS